MATFGKISCLGKSCLVIIHGLALIFVSWYLLIQVEVVQYDAADLFGAFILLTFPIGALLFIVQFYDARAHAYRHPLIVWGLILSGLITLTSGMAWFQIFQFFFRS